MNDTEVDLKMGSDETAQTQLTKLSSNWTRFYKALLPRFWFGFLAIWTIVAVVANVANRRPLAEWIFVLLVPGVMMAFGYFIVCKQLVFDLADEVWDANDRLIVRNEGKELTVPISDIKHVNSPLSTNPPRITLTLRDQSTFGTEVAFMAKQTPRQMFATMLMRQQIHPIARDLIDRIDRIRN